MSKRLFFILLCVMPFLSHAAEESSPKAWLKKMSMALHNKTYDGTFIYRSGDQIHTMRIFHSLDEKGEHERLITLSGKPKEIIRNNDTVTCILPDTMTVVVERRKNLRKKFPHILPENLDVIENYYQIKNVGSERILDKEAIKIIIQPRDSYRYSHRLWIDKDTSMLLKSEMVDENDQLVEQFMFTSLGYPTSLPDSAFISSLNAKNFVWYKNNERDGDSQLRKQNWMVASMPKGFMLEGYRHQYQEARSELVEHMVYSDGMSSVSVFIESLDSVEDPFIGGAPMGAVNVYGVVLDGYQITAMGEAPQQTVKMIAESTYRADKQEE